jgi:hypothetical protein
VKLGTTARNYAYWALVDSGLVQRLPLWGAWHVTPESPPVAARDSLYPRLKASRVVVALQTATEEA